MIAVIVVIVIVGAGVYAGLSSGMNHTNTITTTAVQTQTATQTATHTSVATTTATSIATSIATSVVTSTQSQTVTSVSTFSSASGPSAAPAGGLVVQRNSAYSDNDPRDTSSIDVAQQMYETLTYETSNGTVIPGLATSWSAQGNGATWQYNLRQGVTFSDGTPFNATAVIFSIDNTVAWAGGDSLDVWANFVSATAVSAYVVDITFNQPIDAPIITSAAYSAFMISPNILHYAGLANNSTSLLTGLHTWFNQYHSDGTGPYVINSTASSLSAGVWVLNYNPNYWGGWKTGQTHMITFKEVTSIPTAIQLAEQGQADVIGVGGSFQYIPQLLSAGLNVVDGPTHGSIWLLFNTQQQYLNNANVRQALLTAVNFQNILSEAYYGYGVNFNGAINPGLAYYNSNAQGYGTTAGNLTAAKALMTKAGYPNGLPNVTWTLTYSTGSPFEATIAQLLNTYWAPLGVTISLDGLSFTNQAIKAGYINGSQSFEPGPISYASGSSVQQLALLNWNGATSDPWLVPYELFGQQDAPYQNTIQYNWSYLQNSTFTNTLNQFQIDEATNPTAAANDITNLNNEFYQLAPGAALFQGQETWVVNPHWEGIVMNPNYSFDYFFYYDWYYYANVSTAPHASTSGIVHTYDITTATGNPIMTALGSDAAALARLLAGVGLGVA